MIALHGKNEVNGPQGGRKTEKHGKTVHFATLMDLYHIKDTELDKTSSEYKGRVVLREDVKDDSDSNAELTEQGSSVAKVLDYLPDFRMRRTSKLCSICSQSRAN